jgi:prepilin-type processing-associated H-X9-DG protein
MSNSSVQLFGRVSSRRSRCAYTLLEVLIIIGIIALLATILLTVLSKAREAGRRTACLNNLQSIAKAVLLYANDNDGFLPFAAARKDDMGMNGAPEGHQQSDWISWQCGMADQSGGMPIDNIDKWGIGKYLGCSDQSLSGLTNLRCPSDARLYNSVMVDYAPGQSSPSKPYPNLPGYNQTPYPFSYVLNALMSSANYSTNNAFSGNSMTGSSYIAKTLSRVKDPGSKILVFEEDPRTITDGNAVLAPNGAATDMLAIRHEGFEIDDPSSNGMNDPRDPVMASIASTQPPTLSISNPGKRGNVAFCDGHAEYIQRGTAHLKQYWAPDATMFPTFP